MPLPGGYQVDRSRGGGTWTTRTSDGHVLRTELPPGLSIVRLEFATTSDAALSLPVFTVYDDHVDLEAAVYSSILGGGTWQLVLDVFLRPIDAPDAPLPAPAPEAVDLFLTARAVRSCADPALPTSPWISYEQELAADVIANWRRAGVGTGKDAALAANAVSRSVREGVIESHRSEARYAPGEVGFFQTDFALAALAPSLPRAVSRWLDVPLPEAPQLGDEARALVKERGSSMTVREALAIPPPTLAALLEVDTERARGLVNALLGFGADAESSEAAKAPVVRVHASPQSGGRKGGDKPKA
jgi:hypothetical protein